MTPRDFHTPSASTGDTSAWSRWRIARSALSVAYVLMTFAVINTKGIPTDREIIVGWIAGLALLNTLGRTWRASATVLLSWVPFLLALFLYDFARAIGYWLYRGKHGVPLAVTPQISIDRFLGGGRLWTERLQHWLVSDFAQLQSKTTCSPPALRRAPSAVRWYDVVVSGVYVSHFMVPYLAAGYTWRKGQRLWRWYAGTFVVVSALACLVFAIIPTAPPWYAACKGYIEQFPRGLANSGFSRIGLSFAARVIKKGQNTVNPFAAIPSLHSADALMVSVFMWKFVHRRFRPIVWPILFAYPLWMAFTLVYSGEHYLIDVLSGWALVGVVLGAGWFLRRRFKWTSPWTHGPKFGDLTAESKLGDKDEARWQLLAAVTDEDWELARAGFGDEELATE